MESVDDGFESFNRSECMPPDTLYMKQIYEKKNKIRTSGGI